MKREDIIVGLAFAVAALVLTAVAMLTNKAPEAPVATHQAAPAVAPKPVERINPSFDVVRLSAEGSLVIAGRAEPGAHVDILDGERVIGRVTADGRGEWVFVPDTALAPGRHDLQLRAIAIDGRVASAEAPVTMVVPDQPGGVPLAVKRLADGSSVILLGPTSQAGAGALTIDAVDYEEHKLSASGKAPAASAVRIYLDNQPFGDVTADGDGHWRLAPRAHGLIAGRHTLRADQLDGQGKVAARIEVAFSSGGGHDGAESVTIEPGNSLWRIAHRRYGLGTAYTLIYQANKAAIRDPNLIYPGQVLSLPPK